MENEKVAEKVVVLDQGISTEELAAAMACCRPGAPAPSSGSE